MSEKEPPGVLPLASKSLMAQYKVKTKDMNIEAMAHSQPPFLKFFGR